VSTEDKGIFGGFRKDPHEEEAKAALNQLRKSLDTLYRLRAMNQLATRGQDKTCKFKPEEMAERIRLYRDPSMEARFRKEMVALLRTLYQREPTGGELQAGPPSGDGLGLLPALFGGAALVSGAAWGLSSITNYLSERERQARGQPLQESVGSQIGTVLRGAAVLGILGGAGYGSYRLWRWSRSRKWSKESTKSKGAAREQVEEGGGTAAELEEGGE
jgi:hypothetical protein